MTNLITEARELLKRAKTYLEATDGQRLGHLLRDGYDARYAELVCFSVAHLAELCDALESYKSFADQIAKLPDCNDCASNRDCPYLPNWGTTTRINCPLHKPLPAPPEKEGAEHERD